MMNRRTFLTTAPALLVAPLVAEPQQAGKVFRVGVLGGTGPDVSEVLRGFIARLRELGYAEGRNLVIDGRYYGDRVERLPELAAELVQVPVDVIVPGAPPAPEAARSATWTIPIVLTGHPDPVGAGFVASLARPGSNVTGVSGVGHEFRRKQLQLLKDTLPRLGHLAVLSDPANRFHARELQEVQAAARALNVRVRVLEARGPDDFGAAVSTAARGRAGALVVLGGSMFFTHRAQLAELAIRHRLPSMGPGRESVVAGGLIAYGADIGANFRRAADYVDRILKGAKPADLPVEQPTKFELVINLKTARTLGLTIPPSLLLRADQVIE